MRENILKHLETTWAGQTCLCFPLLDSTNDYAKGLIGKSPVHGTLVVADVQSAGRGRRGRTWQAPKGKAVSMSLLLEPEFLPENAVGLTLVTALAAAEAIEELSGVRPGIKWPNDLVMNGRKICGILTEMVFTEQAYAVIIGIGINVNTEEFPAELADTAASLKQMLGREFSRELLIAGVLKKFEVLYEQYEKTENLALLRERYEKCLVNRGREVRVLAPEHVYSGTAQGITDTGALIVTEENGTTHCVDSGEVSVRGLYGYV